MDRAARVRWRLSLDEGRVPRVYPDSRGYLTAGVGHLLDSQQGAKPISDQVIDIWLAEDVADAFALAAAYPWFAALNDARQDVILCLCFNLGNRFQKFVQTHAAIAAGDFSAAADHLLDSLWAKQVGPTRSQLYARILKTGVWE